MRITTDDGGFGLLVAQRPGYGLFRFQMIVGGRLIGDAEPGMLGSAMRRLAALHTVEDANVRKLIDEPSKLVELLRTDEELHDVTMLSIAESLDGWEIYAYRSGGSAWFVAVADRKGVETEFLTSVVDADEYEIVVDAARRHWQEASGLGGE